MAEVGVARTWLPPLPSPVTRCPASQSTPSRPGVTTIGGETLWIVQVRTRYAAVGRASGSRLEGSPCARRASDIRRTRAAAAPANGKLDRGDGAADADSPQGADARWRQARHEIGR